MSGGWSDLAAIAKAAKSTLSAAQKRIDSVLDIKEEHGVESENSDDPTTKATSSSTDNAENDNNELSSSISLNKLQEDFFAAFGIGSSGADNAAASTGGLLTGKSSWKNIFGSTSTSSKRESRKSDQPTPKSEFIEEGVRINDADPLQTGSIDLSKSSSFATLKSDTGNDGFALHEQDPGDGWCTEDLSVPVASGSENAELLRANSAIRFEIEPSSQEIGDMLTPLDAMTEFSTGARLTLKSDDEDDDPHVDQNAQKIDDVWDQPDDWNAGFVMSFESKTSEWIQQQPKAKFSTSSYDTDAGSATTVVENVGLTGRQPFLDIAQTSTLSSSSTEKSVVSCAESVTASVISNDRSDMTIIDDERSSSSRVERSEEEDAFRPSSMEVVENEQIVMVPDSLTNETPEMEVDQELLKVTDDLPTSDQQQSIVCLPQADELSAFFRTLPLDTSETPAKMRRRDGSTEAKTSSSHSPPQPNSDCKSSETSDDLLDETEPEAATCSDVEIISTPPYDTVSERSSRSGIVLNAADWHMQIRPPNLWRSTVYKEGRVKNGNGSKKTHRRVGSDQSAASFDSVPACSTAGISRSASFTVHDFEKKLAHLSEVLDARERKLVEIAKENAQLADENEQLRNELQQLHARICRDVNVDAAHRELSERLNNVERKYDNVCKERDGLKRKCDNLEKEMVSRESAQKLQQLLKEKEEQIADLMAEGEKLSKQELKQGNMIKKLREKEKEYEKQLESMKNKVKSFDELKQKLKDMSEQEIKYDEMVSELKNVLGKTEKQVLKLQVELEDATEKSSSYKIAMENCAKEIAELKQETAAKDAEIQLHVTKAAESKEGELQDKLTNVEREWMSEKQALLRELNNLKLNCSQEVDEYHLREQSHKFETAQLQKKIQEVEFRNQELAENIASATKPLLRQIESLQAGFRTQQSNWERVENSLYERITEADKAATTAKEKEMEARSSLAELRARASQLEKQTAILAKEKAKNDAALSAMQRESASADAMKTAFADEMNHEKTKYYQATEMLQKEKELMANQFEHERRQLRAQYDTELNEMREKIEQKDQLMVSMRNQLSLVQSQKTSVTQPLMLRISESPPISSIPGGSRDRTPSVSSTMQDEQPFQSFGDFWSNDGAAGGYAVVMEKLRARLQQREGELSVSRDELRSLQQSRDALGSQIIALSNDKCNLEERLGILDETNRQYKELDERYQALLQMYGEQIERNEELKMDLDDVKAMYKQQLESLLQKT